MKRTDTQSGNEAITKREKWNDGTPSTRENVHSTDQWLPNPPLMEQTLIDGGEQMNCERVKFNLVF